MHGHVIRARILERYFAWRNLYEFSRTIEEERTYVEYLEECSYITSLFRFSILSTGFFEPWFSLRWCGCENVSDRDVNRNWKRAWKWNQGPGALRLRAMSYDCLLLCLVLEATRK